ncbi:MAG: hypothetical protein IPK94_06100 [Saprospiraceae bacterium]|nr:hypothetical protein [Saprospiraceae bacterium]
MLNSGLQLIRLKYKQPAMYEGIGLALHLPQYLSFIFTNEPVSELTSIGCHTMLWDFEGHDYHSWVYREQLNLLFPPIHSASSVFQVAFGQKKINVGTGLHDSSAALIPYLTTISEPFILLSTGTWCIAMNPFMQEPLTSEELDQDTLCYITYKGQYVKASRLFLGHEHQEQVDRLCTHFGSGQKKIGSIEYNPGYLSALIQLPETSYIGSNGLMVSGFDSRNLRDYKDFESAYHVLIHDLVSLQVKSISIVQDKNIRSIYVDGGFSRNYIFMKMLALALPELKVFMADTSQASELGSAMSIHEHWNMNDVPPLLLNVKQVKV